MRRQLTSLMLPPRMPLRGRCTATSRTFSTWWLRGPQEERPQAWRQSATVQSGCRDDSGSEEKQTASAPCQHDHACSIVGEGSLAKERGNQEGLFAFLFLAFEGTPHGLLRCQCEIRIGFSSPLERSRVTAPRSDNLEGA
jgi:hypothetical protein